MLSIFIKGEVKQKEEEEERGRKVPERHACFAQQHWDLCANLHQSRALFVLQLNDCWSCSLTPLKVTSLVQSL